MRPISSRSVRPRRSMRGLSLLEMLVALSILGLTLGALYQSVSGATRNTRSGEKYLYGVELARSLLADYAVVPAEGVSVGGETSGDFRWRVASTPLATGGDGPLRLLHGIEVSVSWQDGSKRRDVVLNSVVEVGQP